MYLPAHHHQQFPDPQSIRPHTQRQYRVPSQSLTVHLGATTFLTTPNPNRQCIVNQTAITRLASSPPECLYVISVVDSVQTRNANPLSPWTASLGPFPLRPGSLRVCETARAFDEAAFVSPTSPWQSGHRYLGPAQWAHRAMRRPL